MDSDASCYSPGNFDLVYEDATLKGSLAYHGTRLVRIYRKVVGSDSSPQVCVMDHSTNEHVGIVTLSALRRAVGSYKSTHTPSASSEILGSYNVTSSSAKNVEEISDLRLQIENMEISLSRLKMHLHNRESEASIHI
jgi:hypothetical protein